MYILYYPIFDDQFILAAQFNNYNLITIRETMGQQVQTLEEICEKQEENNTMTISKPLIISPGNDNKNEDNTFKKFKSFTVIHVKDRSDYELFRVKREVVRRRFHFVLPDLQDDFLDRNSLIVCPKN